MGVISPNGPSVTATSPEPEASGAPAYTGVRWVTEYEIDFAEYFAANGAKNFCVAASSHTETLDGLDWTAFGNGTNLDTYTTTFEINANGLQITPVANTADMWGSSCRSPRVGPFVATAVEAGGGPLYNYHKDLVCMQAYITADVNPLTDNYRHFGIALDKHTSGSYDDFLRVVTNTSSSSTPGTCRASITRASSEEAVPSLTNNPNFFEIIVGNNLAAPLGRISDWAGSFPEPLAPLNVSGWSGLEMSAVIKDTEGAAWTGSYPQDGMSDPTYANGRLEVIAGTPLAAPFTATIHKVRYLRLR